MANCLCVSHWTPSHLVSVCNHVCCMRCVLHHRLSYWISWFTCNYVRHIRKFLHYLSSISSGPKLCLVLWQLKYVETILWLSYSQPYGKISTIVLAVRNLLYMFCRYAHWADIGQNSILCRMPKLLSYVHTCMHRLDLVLTQYQRTLSGVKQQL